MPRSRASAKQAGSKFERLTADTFAEHFDDRIDRRVKTGAADKGDIAGLRVEGQRVTVECKDVQKMSIGTWITEAETERVNDKALATMVVHKRKGKAAGLDQYVTMTLADLVALLTGSRPGTES